MTAGQGIPSLCRIREPGRGRWKMFLCAGGSMWESYTILESGSSQQDSFGISENGQGWSDSGKGIFAIVADGMGGLYNGGEISALVTMSMMQTFDQIPRPGDARQELLSMLNQANDEVNARLSGGGQGKSGSTVVAVILRDTQLYWIAVGDSHIYLYRNGALMQINRDHVYSVDLDEMAARGEISSREASGIPSERR